MRFGTKADVLGAFGLDPQYDIDKIKHQCETYKEEMKYEKGAQKSIWEK